MSIILSVNPPHSRYIVKGIQRVEWRKGPLPFGRVFFYETKLSGGCGMVIGQAEISDRYPYETGHDICSCPPAAIADVHRFEEALEYHAPVPLSMFGLTCPPLSWCYCIDPFAKPDLPDWDLHPKF